ncbi:MAG TPA: ABC transporter permease [Rhizomicrobium sp.]
MRYLPLVWAAILRKPMRAIMTLLAVTVAFTVFGLMIGFSATIDGVEQRAHADRVFSSARFGYDDGLPIAVGRRIAGLEGVKAISVASYIPGYVQEPKNHVFINMADANLVRVFPDWQVSQAVWDQIQHDRSGIVMSRLQARRWHKKIGDTFTVIAPQVTRADGSTSWTFKVLSICDDVALAPDGFIFGNYDYYDKSRPLADQGRINEVDLVAADPAHSPQIAQQIDQIFANSATPTQTQTEKMAYAVSNNFGGMDVDTLAREIALAGLLMILFLTANVIAQSVRERFAEFATLRALGYGDGVVIGLVVVVEAVVPCLMGAGLGVALAAWVAHHMQAVMPPSFGVPMPTMSVGVFVGAVASAFMLAFASAVLPTIRLMRMDIATALSGRT